MTAAANPGPVTYLWTREDGDVVGAAGGNGRVRTQDGLLLFQRVGREDEGVYSVVATNAEGAAQAKFSIRVLFPPR